MVVRSSSHKRRFRNSSFVEGEHPVANASPPNTDVGDAPESSVVLHNPFHDVLMGSVAEGSIGAHLAIAELVVAGF